MIYRLVDALSNMRELQALHIAQELLRAGEEPLRILESCRDAMSIIGERFEAGEYFLPELVLAGEMFRQIGEMVKPHIASNGGPVEARQGTVLIGTVRGDLHDIGKNIVVFMLDVNGFQVHDLGIDVPPQRFVQAIAEVKPDIVGLSGFMTVAFQAMKETVEAIERAGLRKKVRIMIGGGMVDEHVQTYTGADAYGRDAMAAVSLARGWVGGS